MKGHGQPDLTAGKKEGHVDDLLGAVVPSRQYLPGFTPVPDSNPGNVIAFAPRVATGRSVPAIECATDDRPAPRAYSRERRRHIALLLGGSLLVHGAIMAAFNREPEPIANIGIISVSAEIVLGANANAGRSATSTESEGVEAPLAPDTDLPPDVRIESARDEKPVEEATEARQDVVAPQSLEPLAADARPEPAIQAEQVAEPKPVEKPPQTVDQKKLETRDARKIREAARNTKDDGENKRDRAVPASTPSTASNNIGRGRSDLDSNYRGIVAAHLARHKQFPADARSRGDQGTVTVTFGISGSGSVSSARLVRGSGVASIDQEATAMVRRASPFPAPPSGRAMTFTVPVSFHLR